ncbi:MAG TPA: MBL fold metallo-hydrolase [Dongiaceae bacterium]|nr:MBL fold metallo-hydrolase [Dongiaceae bacterium]
MKYLLPLCWLLLPVPVATAGQVMSGPAALAPAALRSLAEAGLPEVFVWTDTCNAYVLRDGESAVLIDLGDGGVLDHLPEIGVRRVEWVLFTGHHRELCQGYPRLKAWNARLAAPAAERALFETPSAFRKMRPKLEDALTVHSASYVRPPVQPIPLDRAFARMDTFNWRGHEFWCVETKGNSPGGMTYLVKLHGRWAAFSGDVMLDGARMHNYFDTEWDYGFASGIRALHNAAALVERFEPAWLLPAHGPVIAKPERQLLEFQKKLRRLESLVVRGYDEGRFAAADQDRVSTPTSVPFIWRTTPHLYKFKGPDYYVNFVMILAASGHALLVDCGLFDEAFLDRSLALMRERLGLKAIDAVVISHMHGDHMLEAPHLREKWGASIWALDRETDQMEHPERYDYAAPIQAYGKGFDSVRVDRVLKSGETFQWEGYTLTADWMPGQTEFAVGLSGMIDGRKVVFTGDNIFADPRNPRHSGHEAIVARNSGILEEGYIYGAEYLSRLKPDLIMGGHSFVMDRPAGLIKRYRQWAYAMRDCFQSLSTDPDYRYWFDPFWVRAEPYRVRLARGKSAEVTVQVRNFRHRGQSHHIEIHAPPGVSTQPAALEGSLGNETRQSFPLRLTASPDAEPGVHIVAFDITLDGRRYGEWFDFIVSVEP